MLLGEGRKDEIRMRNRQKIPLSLRALGRTLPPHPPGALGNLRLQLIKLMPGELRIQVLQLRRQLLVTPRFAGLALQRPNLALHFPHQVLDPDEVARYVNKNEARLSPLSKREALKNIPGN